MITTSPEPIFYSVLAFSWLEFLWVSYLSYRQRNIYKEKTEVPKELVDIVDKETFEKARTYALDKSSFGAIEEVFSQLLSSIIMWFFGFKIVWDWAGDINEYCGVEHDHEVSRSIWFVLIFNIFNTVISMPFSIYNTFIIEENHGFNKQTAGFFAKDKFKKFIVSQVIVLPLVAAIIKIIEVGGDYFFIYLWGFVFAFTMFMMVLYPEFIAPLFDKYTPLPAGDLRNKIETLAASIDFPLYKLFVVEGSKRSSHSNAYFYGFFGFKRIVLFDTLLDDDERSKLKSEGNKKEEDKKKGEDKKQEEEKKEEEKKDITEKKEEKDVKKTGCNTDEILAVLGHELGHWKLNHVLKNIVISEVHIFLMFALFNYLYQEQLLYTAFGFDQEKPILIGLVIILQFITAPYNALLDFCMTCLSRHFEFQADAFAVGLGKAKDLRTALIKLNNDNLGYPIYDWLFSAWHHSHPPLLERLEALEDKKEN